DALKILNYYLERRRVHYIVDADIRGFFDHVSHTWMMKFLAHRIADPKLLKLIGRFLKAGIMEKGVFKESEEGTPQGGLISPIIANVYLHYVIDLWFEKVVRRQCKGEAYMVRYADDVVAVFQYEEDAKRYYAEVIRRLAKFNLELAEEKTRIINFGRYATQYARKRGLKKPETFDFLGFTHYCSKSRKGKFRVKRKTSVKKFRASLHKIKEWIKENRHQRAGDMIDSLKIRLIGYYRYYGITDNSQALESFLFHVRQNLFKWLNRRSQRGSYNWKTFQMLLLFKPLPPPKIHVNIYDLRPDINYVL
ncbi:reverse transcriptase domain-containing protein, partial [Heliophilum fasciatum]